MRKFIVILILFFFAILLIGVICYYVPFEIQYRKEIRLGNQLIEQIENFRLQNDSIPEENDYKSLKSLGFDLEYGLAAMYTKLNKTDYIIAYYWGFDPPYLFYYSKTKKWEYGVVPK